MTSPEGGNTILQVVTIMFVLVIGIYFLSDRVIRHKTIVLQTSSVLKVRFALHSVMDYAFHAIQRRYCFDDTLMPAASCELNSGVSGTTGRSVERVLMSAEQANYITAMIKDNNIAMGLENPFVPGGAGTWVSEEIRFVRTINVAMNAKNITTSHPLYLVLEPLSRSLKEELKDVDLHVRLLIERDDTENIPRSGNEVYFSVKVSFEDQSGKVLTIKGNPLQPSASGTPLELVSFGTMYPREVGTFALMLPRDLRLDGSSATATTGDVVLPVLSSDPNPVTGPGLVFKSPVFVNQHVRLPRDPSGTREVNTGRYSPVTFVDRVVLGNGRIYEGENLYVPKTAGATADLFWTDNKLFGGFKQGVTVDGAYDKGLLNFGKVVPGVTVDKTLMDQCIERELAKYDSAQIQLSELYTNIQGSNAPTGGPYNYRFGLTRGNYFKPQGNALHPVSQGGWANVNRNTAATNGAVVNVSVHSSSAPVTEGVAPDPVVTTNASITSAVAQLPRNSTLTLDSTPLSQQYIDHLTAVRDAITDALSLPAGTRPDDIADPDLADEAAAWDAADAKLQAMTAKRASPGQVIISTAQVVFPSTPGEPQGHLLDVTVTLVNPTNFMVESSDHTSAASVIPQVEITAYDGLFHNSALANASISNTKTTRFLNFGLDTTDPDAPVFQSAPSRFSTTLGGAQLASGVAPFATASPNYDDTDYIAFDLQCEAARGAATGQSFGAASWNIDYSDSTAASWNFAMGPTAVTPPTTLVNADYHLAALKEFGCGGTPGGSCAEPTSWTPTIPPKPTGRDEFLPYSIVQDCVVRASADLVAGFFMCQNLIIEPRTKPLNIIGTFIVRDLIFGSYTGAGSATAMSANQFKTTMQHGITWMSIYHPEATPILRRAKILRHPQTPDVTDCVDGITTMPIWAPYASTLIQQQTTLKCNVVSLRASAQNFQWTAVDPDCGVDAVGAANTKCKNHPVNFLVMEHGRGGGP